ncbi:MAG: HIT family protein [Nitrospiraceae bacterium]
MTTLPFPVASTCRACRGEWPSLDLLIGDCGMSRAYLFEDQYFTGWTVLVLKTHATELFALAAPDRARLMDEVAAVAQALAEIYHARKINYELLGNQLPHIHWHLIPRLPNDPAPLEPVWRISHPTVSLTPSAAAQDIAEIRRRLATTLTGFSAP